MTHYAYDAESNLLSITDANGHPTSFAYDAFGRLTQTTFPSTKLETYLYDAAGNLVNKTDRNGHSILYVYDALNRLTHKGYPDSTGVDYVYDLAGKIKQVSDPTGVYGFAYDNMGRLIGTTTQYSFLPGSPAPTFSNSYAYDAASNRTQFTAPDGSTNTYLYDTLDRPTTLTSSLTGQFTFSYDALNRRTGLNRPNALNTTYGYDSLSRLLSVLHQSGGSTTDGASYTYDNAGNRTAKTNKLNNVAEQYVYDAIYQLQQVTHGTTTTESYTYDAVGNRLSSLSVPSYSYNSLNELTSTSVASFTYDNNGNTVSKASSGAVIQYTWDFENRLSSVILPDSGGTVVFKYDPFGRRIQKAFTHSSTTTTTNSIYDGSNSIQEVDQNAKLLVRYTQADGVDEPLSEVRSGITSYYQQDGLSSVTALSNSNGSLANTYVYDSFGNLVTSSGTIGSPFQYTGRDYDSETGLRYYRARYYDPQVGRFISEDPAEFAGSNTNFYSYVGGDPVNFTDPSGLCPPERKRCKISVYDPVPEQTTDKKVEQIFFEAGIDIDFVKADQSADFNVQYTDLSARHALGYAGAAPNLVQLDGAAFSRIGRAKNISWGLVATAEGYVLAHELGHKFLGGGHGDVGIMRSGLETGGYVFEGMDLLDNFHFTDAQAAIIRRKCRQIRRQHPVKH